MSLKTRAPKEAIKRAEPLAKKYQAGFEAFKDNENLTSPALAESVLETARQWESLDQFIEHVVDPKLEKYAGDDTERYRKAGLLTS